MIFMWIAYGLLSLVVYYLWGKSKTAVLYAREKEIQSEHSLSELSFIYPYSKDQPQNILDFEKELQHKLSNVSG